MKEHLTKHLGLCQFLVISISGTWSMLPSVQVRLCFPIPVPLLSYFLSPYSLSSLQTYCKLFSLPISLSLLSLGGVSFTITWFFPIFCKTFWHQSGRFYFACKICYVYQIVFPPVLLLVFFALFSPWYLKYEWHFWFYTFL